MARLGNDEALQHLRAGAFSQYHEVRVLSITAMGAVGDRSMEPALARLLVDPGEPAPKGLNPAQAALVERSHAEVQLAAAGALARIGNPKGTQAALDRSNQSEPMIRAHAAWVMGWFRDDATLARLGKLLEDPVPPVRVAAAAAILRRTK
jgi:HEAT repeat protein